MYEHYESKRIVSRKPSTRNVTKEIHGETARTKSRNGHPKIRIKLPEYRKPESEEIETTDGDDPTSEIEDLNNDDFFYEQLDKRKPTTESSAEVEKVKEVKPNVNRDVVFVHGLNYHKRKGKQRQKFTRINSDAAILADINDDTYDDYGEMELPDSDVEMHDTYEPNTKEGQMQQFDNNKYNYGMVRPNYEQRPSFAPIPKWRMKNPLMLNPRPAIGPMFARPVIPMNMRPMDTWPMQSMVARPVQPLITRPIPKMSAKPATIAPRPNNGMNAMLAYDPPKNSPKLIPLERPIHKQKSERITITKKLRTPAELHEEIDKIFQMKTENYNKKGHEKSHWELRIVPLRYKTHEEYGNN